MTGMADSTEMTETPKGKRDRGRLKAQIAAYLDEFMWRNSYTEERLAEDSGINRVSIYRILHQKVLANENTLVALARVCGVGLLFAAGYSLDKLPAGFEVVTGSNEQPTTKVEIPDLDDPELVFYLRQIGQTDGKTRQIIKNILKAELSQTNSVSYGDKDESTSGGQNRRPDFARHTQ